MMPLQKYSTIFERVVTLSTLLWVSFFIGYTYSLGASAAQDFKLAAYVTNENKDVYVAIFGKDAMELSGCKTKESALEVLELPVQTKIAEETLQNLTQEYFLGQHPSIPCPGVAVDSQISMDHPLWADLEQSKRYYIEYPKDKGVFYSIPSSCQKLKTSFGIRQRVALDGNLQDEKKPGEGRIQQEIALQCSKTSSSTDSSGPETPEPILENGWRVYQAETYLSELGDADLVYVAVYEKVSQGKNRKYFLPIHKIDGEKTTDILWEASERTRKIEKQLKDLFQVTADISQLPFADIDQLNLNPFVEICLANCQDESKIFQHAYFPHPTDMDLVPVKELHLQREVNLHGEEEWGWSYGGPKLSVKFSFCPKILKSLGFRKMLASGKGFKEEMDMAIESVEKDAKVFRCQLPEDNICRRQVAPGDTLTKNHFKKGGECAQKTQLRLEIPAKAILKTPISLNSLGGTSEVVDFPTFKNIEIIGTSKVGRSRIEVVLKENPEMPTSNCLFDKVPIIFNVRNLEGFSLKNIELLLGEDNTVEKILGIHGESTRLNLDNTQLGAQGEGTAPKNFARNLRMCRSSLFSVNGQFLADFMNIQGMNSQIFIYGKNTENSRLKSEDYGVVLNSRSTMRVHQTEFLGQKSFQLKDSLLMGTRCSLQTTKGRSKSQAFRLNGESEVQFKFSSVKEFERIGIFMERKGKIKFILPTNDLVAENDQLSWGEGQFEIVE